jgi:anti-sigma factor ChrR (cupin superfamily)
MAEHLHTGSFEEIVCRDFVELVTAYWEGALPEAQADLVEEHLVMCDWCKTYMDQLELTVAALTSVAGEPSAPSPGAQDQLLQALRARRGE